MCLVLFDHQDVVPRMYCDVVARLWFRECIG
jgi:hypothetical protein